MSEAFWLGSSRCPKIRPHAFQIGSFNHGTSDAKSEASRIRDLVRLDAEFKEVKDINTERWTKMTFNGSRDPVAGCDTTPDYPFFNERGRWAGLNLKWMLPRFAVASLSVYSWTECSPNEVSGAIIVAFLLSIYNASGNTKILKSILNRFPKSTPHLFGSMFFGEHNTRSVDGTRPPRTTFLFPRYAIAKTRYRNPSLTWCHHSAYTTGA